MSGSPAIACGDWHDDKWISPYVRGVFAAPPGRKRLDLGIYNPASAKFENSLVVRLGCQLLAVTPAIAPDTFIDWSHTFGEAGDAGGELSISLRTVNAYDAGGSDARELGLVITAWTLHSAVDPDEQIQIGSQPGRADGKSKK